MFDPHAAYNDAEQLMNAEQLEEAHAALANIVEQEDSFVLAHLALARVCTKLGRHLDAVQHAQRACELEPQDAFNFTTLSVTCQRAWAGTQDQKFIQMAEDAMAKAQSMR